MCDCNICRFHRALERVGDKELNDIWEAIMEDSFATDQRCSYLLDVVERAARRKDAPKYLRHAPVVARV